VSTPGIPPGVTEESAPFWDAAKEGRLIVERCTNCGAESFPPRGICRTCRCRELEWVEIAGPGRVYSYTVNHQRWLPDLEVPYTVALVEFPDHPGVRVVGRLHGEPVIDGEVTLGFEEGPDGFNIPSFTAA
jgi:uncharacterized OB-fold protein